MDTAQKTIKYKKGGRSSINWKVCLVTSRRKVEKILTTHLGPVELRVERRLSNLIDEGDCSLFIIDTKVPDIKVWPAPILVNPDALYRPWCFLLGKLSDASSLGYLPSNSKFFERTESGINVLTSYINKIMEPESSKIIERVSYLESIRSFVVHMGNARVYLVKMSDLSEADSSCVVQYRVGRNHNHFKVRQESGNRFEVPWDEILYHYEPEYEYYKGKQVQVTDISRARYIGKKVREIRIKRGLSIEELAKRVGLKRPNLSRIEHGKHVPSLETLERISVPLGVPVADIVALPGENQQVALPVSPVRDTTVIKVIGLGGAGCSTVNRMIQKKTRGVEFITMDTDNRSLDTSKAPTRIQLGKNLSRGLGVGSGRRLGQTAAKKSRDEIKELLAGTDMVFITGGLGGGTGTGAVPVIAEVAREIGALTIAVVTKPFKFESAHRFEVAREGICELLNKVDTLIIIPGDCLLDLSDQNMGVDDAFKMADDIISHGIQVISEAINTPGMISLDFTEIKAVMKDAGPAWMSIGRGSGKNRAVDAAREALASPLLDVTTAGSKVVLFNIIGSSDLTLFEVNEAAEVIKQAVNPDANIIFSMAHDPDMKGDVRITLIATVFVSKGENKNTEEEDKLTKQLKNIETEYELCVPSFLRRPLFGRRRKTNK